MANPMPQSATIRTQNGQTATIQFAPGLTPQEMQQEIDAAEQRLLGERGPSGPTFGGAAVHQGAFEVAKAVPDIAATMATSIPASIVGGLSGITGLLLTGGDPDAAAAAVRGVSDFFTWDPKTKVGRATLEKVAPVFQALEDHVDTIAVEGSGGSPLAATYIKTALWGTPEILAIMTGARLRLPAKAQGKLNQVSQIAEELDIDLSSSNMRGDVVRAARAMTPEERGQRMPQLQEALRHARQAHKDKLEIEYELARQGQAMVNAPTLAAFGKMARQKALLKGADLPNEPLMRARLADLDSIQTDVLPSGRNLGMQRADPIIDLQTRTASQARARGAPGEPRMVPRTREWIDLSELDILVRRVNKNIRTLKKATDRGAEYTHMLGLRTDLERLMNRMFDDRLIAAGRMFKGDAGEIRQWQKARNLTKDFYAKFDGSKALARLIHDKDITPEGLSKYIIGLHATNAPQHANALIKSVKSILGDNHPVLEGIRLDVKMSLMAPLLKEKPNFNQFVDNMDNFLTNQRTLAQQLGMNMERARTFRNMASTAAKLPEGKQKIFNAGELLRGTAIFLAPSSPGVSMARGQFQIRTIRRLGHTVFRMDEVSQKKLIADLTGVQFDAPIAPRNGPLFGAILADSMLTQVAIDEAP
jgi:hypothetical protein